MTLGDIHAIELIEAMRKRSDTLQEVANTWRHGEPEWVVAATTALLLNELSNCIGIAAKKTCGMEVKNEGQK